MVMYVTEGHSLNYHQRVLSLLSECVHDVVMDGSNMKHYQPLYFQRQFRS